MLKYFLLGLAALYVAWNVFKAVMEWADRRKEKSVIRLAEWPAKSNRIKHCHRSGVGQA